MDRRYDVLLFASDFRYDLMDLVDTISLDEDLGRVDEMN